MPILCRVLWPSDLHGPFRLGRAAWVVNILSLAFIALMTVLFVLPTVRPVTASNMNYAGAAIGGLVGLVTIQWVLWGRHVYTGVVHTYVGDEEVGTGERTEKENIL
jgi:hypothetical protein